MKDCGGESYLIRIVRRGDFAQMTKKLQLLTPFQINNLKTELVFSSFALPKSKNYPSLSVTNYPTSSIFSHRSSLFDTIKPAVSSIFKSVATNTISSLQWYALLVNLRGIGKKPYCNSNSSRLAESYIKIYTDQSHVFA